MGWTKNDDRYTRGCEEHYMSGPLYEIDQAADAIRKLADGLLREAEALLYDTRESTEARGSLIAAWSVVSEARRKLDRMSERIGIDISDASRQAMAEDDAERAKVAYKEAP